MRDARSHVDGHIWKLIEALREFVHIPFETSQVSTYKTHVRILFNKTIARIDLIFVGWVFRMKVHVILRMVLEILTVVIHRHFIEWKPAIFWLSQMRHYRFVLIDYKFHHRIKFRIINHDKLSG